MAVLLRQLLQADRRRQAGGPAADDHHIIVHCLALHLLAYPTWRRRTPSAGGRSVRPRHEKQRMNPMSSGNRIKGKWTAGGRNRSRRDNEGGRRRRFVCARRVLSRPELRGLTAFWAGRMSRSVFREGLQF